MLGFREMVNASGFLKRNWLEATLFICVGNLAWLVYSAANSLEPVDGRMVRNSDFPNTYISSIHLDLTSPNSNVTLTWAGPNAIKQDAGPFHSSPGAGWGTNDCNDPIESNCLDSQCTPKGTR